MLKALILKTHQNPAIPSARFLGQSKAILAGLLPVCWGTPGSFICFQQALVLGNFRDLPGP